MKVDLKDIKGNRSWKRGFTIQKGNKEIYFRFHKRSENRLEIKDTQTGEKIEIACPFGIDYFYLFRNLSNNKFYSALSRIDEFNHRTQKKKVRKLLKLSQDEKDLDNFLKKSDKGLKISRAIKKYQERWEELTENVFYTIEDGDSYWDKVECHFAFKDGKMLVVDGNDTHFFWANKNLSVWKTNRGNYCKWFDSDYPLRKKERISLEGDSYLFRTFCENLKKMKDEMGNKIPEEWKNKIERFLVISNL